MSTQRKRAGKRPPARPKKNPSKTRSPAASPRRISPTLAGAQEALEECIGAVCLVEVTLHSLEFQEVATPEQEALKRALKMIRCVQDWVGDLRLHDLARESTGRKEAS